MSASFPDLPLLVIFILFNTLDMTKPQPRCLPPEGNSGVSWDIRCQVPQTMTVVFAQEL